MPPPACWRRIWRPSRARKIWSRSGARARRAGRHFAAELERLRHRRRSAHRRHAGGGAHRRRSGAAAHQLAFQKCSACRWNGSRRRKCAGASRISPQDRRRGVEPAGPSGRQPRRRRRAARRRAEAGVTMRENTPVERIVISGGRVTGIGAAANRRRRCRRAGGRRLVARHGGLAREHRCRRCGRSRGRCWRCGWTRGAAAHACGLGAGRLSGAAPGRPADDRRDG